MEKKNTDVIRKMINLSPRLQEMVDEIRDKAGYTSDTAVVHQGIIELHSKIMGPVYARGKAQTPEEKIDSQKAKRQAKQEEAEEQGAIICERLGGEVDVEDGSKVCRYYTYDGKKRYQQKMSLHLLTDQTLDKQYAPSKKKVLELQERGKTDY